MMTMDTAPKKRDSNQVAAEDDAETSKKARPTNRSAASAVVAEAVASKIVKTGDASSEATNKSANIQPSRNHDCDDKVKSASTTIEAAGCDKLTLSRSGDVSHREKSSASQQTKSEGAEPLSCPIAYCCQPWDLESALHRIAQVGDSTESSRSKEILSSHVWVKFRVGHTGDASAIVACYQKSAQSRPKTASGTTLAGKFVSSSSDSDDPSSLEVRLADSLGDEDSPPFVFALLAELFSEEIPAISHTIGAAALLTLHHKADTSKAVIRLEWLYVDRHSSETKAVADILERRVWLRLSTLSVMTSCELSFDDISIENAKSV